MSSASDTSTEPHEGARPFVTIAVPCLNEEKYIEACLDSLRAQDYPAGSFEIIVTDGGSTDGTRDVIERIAKTDPRVKLVHNPYRIQAAGLNVAIREGKGSVVVRADVHADYAKDYVSKCVEVLGETGAWNVGGAARPAAKNAFQRAMCAALRSPLSFGGSKYRDAKNEGWAESVFPGAFRREVFEKVGGFDPKAITNEDAEINQRIWEAGGKVWLSAKIVVQYYPRDSFKGLASQYFKYGRGRARTLLKRKKFLSIRPAVPFLAVVGETALSILSPPLGLTALAGYGALTLIEACRVGLREGVSTIPIVWAIFPTLHLAHGVGFGTGLIKYAIAPDWTAEDVKIPSNNSRTSSSGEPAMTETQSAARA